MIDLMGLFFIILIFAPFLLIIIPTLLCYKLTGRWWPKPEAEAVRQIRSTEYNLTLYI